MKNKVLFIWIILTLLVLIISVSINSNQAVYCWDGVEVEEPLLEELCGISKEEYFSADFNLDDCPEALDAVHMIGGCETDWPTVWMLTAMVMALYLLLSGLFFIIRWFVKRGSR